MKINCFLKRLLVVTLFACFPCQQTYSQCFEIESILVDACGGQEGLNEMVRFKVGNVPLNTSSLSVSWPNNPWQGLVQNAITAQKVASLNADILDAGGCGELLEPTGGILPANATVILVTSFNFDTALNSFGALTQNIYIVFQDNPSTASGHFANSGTGLRSLTINFGSCTETVAYNRALLVDTAGNTVAADGAIVLFGPAGTATYINNGCSAPVPPFTVEAGPSPISACPGGTISLHATALGQQTVLWSSASGSFSNPTGLATDYFIDTSATGSITLTLTATNSCGLTISDSVNVNINGNVVPDFSPSLTLCTGANAPTLNNTSPNGITGSWNPPTISNTASGTYIFTPNVGQCAASVALSVTVSNSTTPDFATTLTLCTGANAPTLNNTSPNGITGSWNPPTISNTSSGTYIFTPNVGQCAASVTLNVTVNPITANVVQDCEDGDVVLVATGLGQDTTFEWKDKAGNTLGSDAKLNITDLLAGATNVSFPVSYTLYISSPGGCTSAIEAMVYNTYCGIPKGLSPNGDGKNDAFDLSGLGVNELSVFNRYGLKVYSRTAYTNQWNGQGDNGKELPDATYYYVIVLTNNKIKTGWVYINR